MGGRDQGQAGTGCPRGGVGNAGRTRVNVAITGANGSVGSILLRHVADQAGGHAVACVRSERAAAALRASPRRQQTILGGGPKVDRRLTLGTTAEPARVRPDAEALIMNLPHRLTGIHLSNRSMGAIGAGSSTST